MRLIKSEWTYWAYFLHMVKVYNQSQDFFIKVRRDHLTSGHMFVTVNVSFNANACHEVILSRSSFGHELMSRSQVVTKLLFTDLLNLSRWLCSILLVSSSITSLAHKLWRFDIFTATATSTKGHGQIWRVCVTIFVDINSPSEHCSPPVRADLLKRTLIIKYRIT